MPAKLTQEEYIKRATIKHNGYYDYSNVEYKDMYSHIKIICPEHGEFKQLPVKHIVGHGCIICNLANAYNLLRLSKNEFIKRATKIHGDRYDYSKVIYSNNRTCVNIICKEHGSFWQRPDSHMRRGAGCPKCLQSHGEREVSNYLNSIDIKYLTEYRFPNCKAIRPLPFDFYLPDLNICIEYD